MHLGQNESTAAEESGISDAGVAHDVAMGTNLAPRADAGIVADGGVEIDGGEIANCAIAGEAHTWAENDALAEINALADGDARVNEADKAGSALQKRLDTGLLSSGRAKCAEVAISRRWCVVFDSAEERGASIRELE